MTKDYYKILGIDESETSDNIKNAYRKLARKWHPDIAGNTPDVIAKFKEINEAYDILSNKTKKEEYDRARRFYSYANNTNFNKTTENKKTTNPQKEKKSENFAFDWETFISRKKREKNSNQKTFPQKGDDIYTEIEITVLEAINGCTKTINMLQTNICEKCNGRKFINNSTCKFCNGKGETSNYKKFNIKIPAGIKNKSKIRLASEGAKGFNGGRNGDLYVTISIKENNEYQTEGLNIYKTVPITPWEAVLGCSITLNTLGGKINFSVPARTQNGQKIRLNNCGVVQKDKIGDMIITVEIKIPQNLSQEELTLYKKLAECSTKGIRDDIYGQ